MNAPFSFLPDEAPAIPRETGTPWAGNVANPSIIAFRDRYFLYFRGEATPGARSSVSVRTAPRIGFDPRRWSPTTVRNPILVSPDSTELDPMGLHDPCAVVFRGRVFLFTMQVTNEGGGRRLSNVRLATSRDGLRFTDWGLVVRGRGTPCAAVKDGRLHLFHTARDAKGTGWEYRAVTSDDGFHFDLAAERPVIGGSGVAETFDRLGVSTARIFSESGWHYLTYGGCSWSDDYPEGIGVARSRDLVTWERHPSPILLRGPKGAWNEGAVWSGTVLRHGERTFLWYEGVGSGQGAASPASDSARDSAYGGYNATSCSQVGLAVSTGHPWTEAPRGQASLTPGEGKAIAAVISHDAGFLSILVGEEALEVAGGSRLPGARVGRWSRTGRDNQRWHLVPLESGAYAVVNRWSGMVLSAEREEWVQRPWAGAPGQRWRIER